MVQRLFLAGDIDTSALNALTRPGHSTAAELAKLRKTIVTPGQLITADPQFMRGHGTYLLADEAAATSAPTDALMDEMDLGTTSAAAQHQQPQSSSADQPLQQQQHELFASLAGQVERVNKLVSVTSLHARYTPQIGDVVVGRITDVAAKRWRVDVFSRQDAMLLLSSVNLPGGVQRRKLESDALQMRSFFAENDILVAEVQQFFSDGAISLHTRSLKYGKLRNGCMVQVPPALITRSKAHFHQLPIGVDLILGVNGYIWVSKHVPVLTMEDIENDTGALYTNTNATITAELRQHIARVRNCIVGLSQHSMPISEVSVMQMFEASLGFPAKDILLPDTLAQLLFHVRDQQLLSQQ